MFVWWFILEIFLQLLGKELPLRKGSKFLESQKVKPVIKMQLAPNQDSSKEHLPVLWAFTYLWIACTGTLLPRILCTEKDNLGGSWLYDFQTS